MIQDIDKIEDSHTIGIIFTDYDEQEEYYANNDVFTKHRVMFGEMSDMNFVRMHIRGTTIYEGGKYLTAVGSSYFHFTTYFPLV